MGCGRCLPEGGAFGPRDFQKVVTVLELEVNEDQSNGVPQLGQDGPRAVGVVVVLRREVGAGDDATLAPQGPAAGIVRCGQETGGSCELALFGGPSPPSALHGETWGWVGGPGTSCTDRMGLDQSLN